MIEYVVDEALPDREEILERLASHDRDVVLRVLTLLCPCRNACYDLEIWSKLPALWRSQWDGEVRSAAHHAFLTLRDVARVDRRARELLDQLAGRMRSGVYAPDVRRRMRTSGHVACEVYPKVARRDLPTLIESLASADDAAIADAMAALCPKDGRHAPKKVWRAILAAQRSPDPALRRKAVAASAALDVHQMICAVSHE